MHFMMDSINQLDRLVNQPDNWHLSDAKELYAGVDLGTYKTIAIVIDETGFPRAAAMRKTEIARSGLIIDYVGALNTVRELMDDIRAHSPMPITKGATSYPPQTEATNLKTTSYILEGVELEVLRALDEPTAANQVLKMVNGAIVDVGGGTTGIAVIEGGQVVFTDDEATGGVHLSLVLAGAKKISYEAAEKIKIDPEKKREVLPIVRPVIEKIASIIDRCLKDFKNIDQVCLVGGTCELDGFPEIVSRSIGRTAFRPALPRFTTPYGIALSCLDKGSN